MTLGTITPEKGFQDKMSDLYNVSVHTEILKNFKGQLL